MTMYKNKYKEAFRLLFDDYYMTPKHWEDYETLKELIDKQEKYRWHYLRKDPNDLPKNLVCKKVLVCQSSSWGTNYYDLCYYDNKGFNYCDSEYGDIYLDNVLAWKYIEEFGNE